MADRVTVDREALDEVMRYREEYGDRCGGPFFDGLISSLEESARPVDDILAKAEAEHLRLAKGYQRQYDAMEQEVLEAEAAIEQVRALCKRWTADKPGSRDPWHMGNFAAYRNVLRVLDALDPPAVPEAEAPTCPHPDDRRGPDGDWCSACGRPVCVACGGSGRSAFLAGSRPCPRCGGSGVVPTPTEEP